VVGGRGARTDRLDRLLEGLSQAERDRIAPYLNYDMVGSPNYIFMVNDADESTFPAPVPIPEGSVAIEDLYESYYTLIGEPYDDTEVSGRSDYQAFIEAGIPSGGLFTGAEEINTPEAAGDLGWYRRGAVRPVLPRGVRHARELRSACARGEQ
jgi:Zn-dependent M28 family amino/carboxypeptidase